MTEDVRRALPYARMLELAPEQIMISYNGALLKRINGEEISTLHWSRDCPELSGTCKPGA